jgi:hypothetical protein
MPPPDRPTAEEAAALVQSALGLASPPALRPIVEGGEHFSWWVDDRYVARFAPDRERSLDQRREVALRELIRPYASVPLPIGRLPRVGPWLRLHRRHPAAWRVRRGTPALPGG